MLCFVQTKTKKSTSKKEIQHSSNQRIHKSLDDSMNKKTVCFFQNERKGIGFVDELRTLKIIPQDYVVYCRRGLAFSARYDCSRTHENSMQNLWNRIKTSEIYLQNSSKLVNLQNNSQTSTFLTNHPKPFLVIYWNSRKKPLLRMFLTFEYRVRFVKISILRNNRS